LKRVQDDINGGQLARARSTLGVVSEFPGADGRIAVLNQSWNNAVAELVRRADAHITANRVPEARGVVAQLAELSPGDERVALLNRRLTATTPLPVDPSPRPETAPPGRNQGDAMAALRDALSRRDWKRADAQIVAIANVVTASELERARREVASAKHREALAAFLGGRCSDTVALLNSLGRTGALTEQGQFFLASAQAASWLMDGGRDSAMLLSARTTYRKVRTPNVIAGRRYVSPAVLNVLEAKEPRP